MKKTMQCTQIIFKPERSEVIFTEFDTEKKPVSQIVWTFTESRSAMKFVINATYEMQIDSIVE